MAIGDRLAELIKLRNTNPNQLSIATGVNVGTIYSIIRRNNKKVDLEDLKAICKELNVSLDYFAYEDGASNAEPSQVLEPYIAAHIAAYRSLDPHGREVVDKVTEIEKARSDKERAIIEHNKEVSERAVLHLLPISRNAKNDDTPVKVYVMPASAGFGECLEDYCEYDTVTFPGNRVPYRTDFGVRISGDSMEPDIRDGDTVFVESRTALNDGEVGIFVLNGDGYCKELCIDREEGGAFLLSHNSKYAPMPINEYDSLYTVGRVVGVYSEREE